MNPILFQTLFVSAALISCLPLIQAGVTVLIGKDVSSDGSVIVPMGAEYKLICLSNNVSVNASLEYRHQLYEFETNGFMVSATASWSYIKTNKKRLVSNGQAKLTMTTVFVMNAEQAGSQKYSCLEVPANGEAPRTIQTTGKEVVIRVCAEPDIQFVDGDHNDHLNGSSPRTIVLNAEEKCGLSGELTYLLNGVQVPWALDPEAASSQAIEREHFALEINSTCQSPDDRECNVTAVFTYLSEGRFRTSTKNQQVSDCCITSGPEPTEGGKKITDASAKVLTETTGLGSTQEPQTATELRELEISKLRLEIDVLTLKRKLLPLQIGRHKRLRALSRQSPLEVEESGSDRVQ